MADFEKTIEEKLNMNKEPLLFYIASEFFEAMKRKGLTPSQVVEATEKNNFMQFYELFTGDINNIDTLQEYLKIVDLTLAIEVDENYKRIDVPIYKPTARKKQSYADFYDKKPQIFELFIEAFEKRMNELQISNSAISNILGFSCAYFGRFYRCKIGNILKIKKFFDLIGLKIIVKRLDVDRLENKFIVWRNVEYDLATTIKEIVKEKGISLEVLAERLELPLQTLNTMLFNNNFKVRDLVKIAKALEVELKIEFK